MDSIAGSKPTLVWAVHLSAALLVLLWIFPTVGLLVSSFRTGDQIASSGWWAAMFPSEQSFQLRTAGAGDQALVDGLYTVSGNLFVVDGRVAVPEEGEPEIPYEIVSWGVSSRDIAAHAPGDAVDMGDGEIVTVQSNGDYVFTSAEEMGGRGQRIFVTAESPPEFTFANYDAIIGKGIVQAVLLYGVIAAVVGVAAVWGAARMGLSQPKPIGVTLGVAIFAFAFWWTASSGEMSASTGTDNMVKAFFNTLTVTIPATIIPILIAAFAAYALAWMDFPGRALLISAIVGLLVVPLQLALIPLLTLHNQIGIGKGYLGVWLAHTGFGLPLAIYLLRNYMVGLPRDIIENAKVDGATDFQIFTKIILPLSFPALASFAIFQFLWTWNDLLVAQVFLIDSSGQTTVMTRQIVELLGTRGGNWEILATAAFVSIAVPLGVFFAMQKYLVRGLLAGSVK